MFIKIFESNDSVELEKEVNTYLKSEAVKDFDLHSIVQSESMAEVGGKLEKRLTLTCILIESFYQDDMEDF